MIFRVDVTVGMQNGNTIIDVYTVGKEPRILSGLKPHNKKEVKSIEIYKASGWIEATIFFEDEMYYTNKVTDYYEQQPYSTYGDTPTNKGY